MLVKGAPWFWRQMMSCSVQSHACTTPRNRDNHWCFWKFYRSGWDMNLAESRQGVPSDPQLLMHWILSSHGRQQCYRMNPEDEQVLTLQKGISSFLCHLGEKKWFQTNSRIAGDLRFHDVRVTSLHWNYSKVSGHQEPHDYDMGLLYMLCLPWT